MWLCERWIVIHSRPQLESFSFVCLLSPHCLLFLPAPIYVDLPHLPASLPRLSPTDSFAPIPLPFFLTPNSASRPPFALAPCLYFWVAVFPLPRKRPPPKSSLFTSLFPSFYPSLLFLTHSPRPNSLSLPLSPPHFVYLLRLLQTLRQADWESGISGEVGRRGTAQNKEKYCATSFSIAIIILNLRFESLDHVSFSPSLLTLFLVST